MASGHIKFELKKRKPDAELQFKFNSSRIKINQIFSFVTRIAK